MPCVASSILIAAPAQRVFDLSQDYALRLEWDPFLRAIRFLDGATTAAAGVRVWVRAWNGLSMTAQYVSVDPPGVAAIRMVRGPWLFREFAGSWRFRPVGPAGEHTEAIFRYTFKARGGWVGRAVIEPTVARVFARDIRARLAALKEAAERE